MSEITYSASYQMRNGLPHLKKRLSEEKGSTIAYLGGSITEGAGASLPDGTSWRVLLSQWFEQSYPRNQFIFINAAVGGTTSELGAFRIEEHIIAESMPDVLFLEFAVNDSSRQREEAIQSYEGIIRHLKRRNPAVEIVCIYTVDIRLKQNAVITYQEEVAAYYELPSINLEQSLMPFLLSETIQWTDLAKDEVHPSDLGHSVYAQIIEESLVNILADSNAIGQYGNEKAPFSVIPPLEYGVMASPLDGVIPNEKSQWIPKWHPAQGDVWNWRYDRDVLEFVGAGNGLQRKFTGTFASVLLMVGQDCAIFKYRIDGGEWIEADPYDHWCTMCHRPIQIVLSPTLTNGEHLLEVQISQQKEAGRGEAFRILKWLDYANH
jgi:acyl-CoA thioesterase-1